MTKKFFVTGTDTGVGKTFVSCALLEAARAKGLSTLALKPVAAGVEIIDGSKRNEDALLLQRHMSVDLPYEQVNPVVLDAATSPHIAAHLEERQVSVSRLLGYCRGALLNRTDFALVEGAGGWRVPISNRETLADLAKELEFPVILVVSLRLGCLNHAMLTAEAIVNDGLTLAGWIGNRVEPQPMDYESHYISSLRGAIKAPMLGCLPFSFNRDPSEHTSELDCSALDL